MKTEISEPTGERDSIMNNEAGISLSSWLNKKLCLYSAGYYVKNLQKNKEWIKDTSREAGHQAGESAEPVLLTVFWFYNLSL